MKLPAPLEALIQGLQRLPGVGPKSAQRMGLHLLKEGPESMRHLADLLEQAASQVGFCDICGAFADQPTCSICADPNRDDHVLLVVAEASNLFSFERTGQFRGRYHVLEGLVSGLKGIGPDQLRIRELLERLKDGRIQELILATNPTLDGEATAAYLMRLLKPLNLKITRIGMGLPMGSDLEYADDMTLGLALQGRRSMGD